MNTKVIIFLILILQFILTVSSYAQKTYVIKTTDMEFTPAKVIVNPGDTLKWINTSKGLHNVVADDESFSSGDPSIEEWIYIHVFKKEGINPYYCLIHGSKGGIGMSGIIKVQLSNKKNNNIKNSKK